MSPSHKPSKGKLVADEGADRRYVEIARTAGWDVINISPQLRGQRLSDTMLVTKYTGGIHPIFSSDRLAYKINPKQLGRSGYILHKGVQKEEAAAYKKQVERFFTKYSEKNTHKWKWTIEITGEATRVSIK